ncbi:MAG: hypothetical protein HQL19_01010 [Candidatus Omnitrophica bacterium]|nr:hypothetical protein [Candidatus Omnitrophota bacterium]
MRNEIVNLFARLNDRSCRILALEALLFSGVFGLAYRSWVLFGVLLLLLWSALVLFKSKVFVMIALSCLWGFIAASIGYSSGGWPWALACGAGMMVIGVLAHVRELNFSLNCDCHFPVVFSSTHRWRKHYLN